MSSINKGEFTLMLGALGVVFGDIGTSPLYALQVVFGNQGNHISITKNNVIGIISLIIWSLALVVSIKFIALIMRADNQGEGGILALTSLVKNNRLLRRYKAAFIVLGLIGACLFYGDSIITPAISVLSAVEGLKVVTPHLNNIVLPITLALLTLLFWVQKYGTSFIGRMFGPVMLTWFLAIALGGGWQVLVHPEILMALSPITALHYFITNPVLAFIAMSAVVLAITGAEALYADMGHFGRPPIARAWFYVVFPSLILCYMGQASLILSNPHISGNLLVRLYPALLRIPFIFLATLATLIASQSVISGAFSLTHQAIQLKFLPKLIIKHTSDLETGQIYLPFVNIVLFVAVTLLVIIFGSSAKLANAYGIAVSGTLAADSVLFLVIMRSIWRSSIAKVLIVGLLFLPIDLLFISSNSPKVLHGGWVPILIGGLLYIIIDTWTRGERIVEASRRAIEGPLQLFVDKVHNSKPPVVRVDGSAIYLGHHPDMAPLALHSTLEEMHELPKNVVIVSVDMKAIAHVPLDKRVEFDGLKYSDGISHLTLHYGFHDFINVPRALKSVRHLNSELNFDAEEVPYFISLSAPTPTKRHNLASWRKSLYCFMDRNALSNANYYKLPLNKTEEMLTPIKL